MSNTNNPFLTGQSEQSASGGTNLPPILPPVPVAPLKVPAPPVSTTSHPTIPVQNAAEPAISEETETAPPAEQELVPETTLVSQASISQEEADKAVRLLNIITTGYNQKMVGQERLKRNLLIALLANSHVLLESVPGLAKSLAASTLASTISGVFNRIQCTADLMPSDISGSQIFNQQNNTFETQLGPVFANILLVDEINRSSAKSQSAMLEAMAERQVTIGGETHRVPNPFLVIATQNPVEQEGVYHLAEAQLDRFLIKDILSYPEPEEEVEILNRVESGVLDSRTHFIPQEVITTEDVLFLQDITSKVYVDTSIKQYIINLVYATRHSDDFLPAHLAGALQMGASPRATIGLMVGAKALALLNGRTHVIPEDVKELRHEILRHRLMLNFEADMQGVTVEQIIDMLFNIVTVP